MFYLIKKVIKISNMLKPKQTVIPLIKLEHKDTDKTYCMGWIFHTARKRRYSFDEFIELAKMVAEKLPPIKREHILNSIDGTSPMYISFRKFYKKIFTKEYKYPQLIQNHKSGVKRTNSYRAMKIPIPDFSYAKEALYFLSYKCEERRFSINGFETFCDRIESKIRIGGQKSKFTALVKRWKPILKDLCYGTVKNWQISYAYRKRYKEVYERLQKREQQQENIATKILKEPIKIPKKVVRKIPTKVIKIPKKLD